ncbi:response regulator transcription factor [Streptomyces sp. NPDC088387]|uniref:response regulator transcription factor n=1 Tax=Streptomyces sp. NPDC088387 TaxID=3365859 RepID=UPI003822789F
MVHTDDPIVRMGLAGLVEAEPDFVLITSPVDQEGVDVVVLAVESVDASTVELLQKFAVDGSSETRFCLIVGGRWQADVSVAIQRGVRAVLWRSEFTPQRFTRTLRAVHKGWGDFPPTIQGGLLDHMERVRSEVLAPRGLTASGFSARELDILRLMSSGFTLPEISEKLCYSERTVKNVLYALTKRFNLRNRTHVVSYAIRAGLI